MANSIDRIEPSSNHSALESVITVKKSYPSRFTVAASNGKWGALVEVRYFLKYWDENLPFAHENRFVMEHAVSKLNASENLIAEDDNFISSQ